MDQPHPQKCPVVDQMCSWLKCATCRAADIWMYQESDLARYNQRLDILEAKKRITA